MCSSRWNQVTAGSARACWKHCRYFGAARRRPRSPEHCCRPRGCLRGIAGRGAQPQMRLAGRSPQPQMRVGSGPVQRCDLAVGLGDGQHGQLGGVPRAPSNVSGASCICPIGAVTTMSPSVPLISQWKLVPPKWPPRKCKLATAPSVSRPEATTWSGDVMTSRCPVSASVTLCLRTACSLRSR